MICHLTSQTHQHLIKSTPVVPTHGKGHEPEFIDAEDA